MEALTNNPKRATEQLGYDTNLLRHETEIKHQLAVQLQVTSFPVQDVSLHLHLFHIQHLKRKTEEYDLTSHEATVTLINSQRYR